MANEITSNDPKDLTSAVTKASDAFMSDVVAQNSLLGLKITDGGKRCGTNLVLALASMVKGAEHLKELDRTEVVRALQYVVTNELDIYSNQCYIDKRNTKDGITFTVQAQGDGLELMVRKWGVDVKSVHGPWLVHEGDEFQLPQFEGLKQTPAVFKPKVENMNKPVIMVVYLIEKTTGTKENPDVDYCTATRESVASNLMAQILNATLGDRPSKYDFPLKEKDPGFKKAMDDWHNRLVETRKKLEGKTLDQILSDPEFDEIISPAYKSPATKEGMLIRKMRKNALLHYTRDLGNGAVNAINRSQDEDYDHTFDQKDVVSNQDGNGNSEGTRIEPPKFDENGEAKGALPNPQKSQEEKPKEKPEPEKVEAKPDEKPAPKKKWGTEDL